MTNELVLNKVSTLVRFTVKKTEENKEGRKSHMHANNRMKTYK